MKKYVDYCPRCPWTLKEKDVPQKRNPAKCHYCSPNDLRSILLSHVDASRDIQKLAAKVTEANLGQDFYRSKQWGFEKRLLEHYTDGTHAIQLGGIVILVNRFKDTVSIQHYKLEKL